MHRSVDLCTPLLACCDLPPTPAGEDLADREEADLELFSDGSTLHAVGSKVENQPDVVIAELGSMMIFADNMAPIIGRDESVIFHEYTTRPPHHPFCKLPGISPVTEPPALSLNMVV